MSSQMLIVVGGGENRNERRNRLRKATKGYEGERPATSAPMVVRRSKSPSTDRNSSESARIQENANGNSFALH